MNPLWTVVAVVLALAALAVSLLARRIAAEVVRLTEEVRDLRDRRFHGRR